MLKRFRRLYVVIVMASVLALIHAGRSVGQETPPGTANRTLITTGEPSREVSTDLRKRSGSVYAVIIGIGNYQDERLNLRFTANDAHGLYDVLTNPNYGGIPKDHVKLLLNQEATVQNIKRSIGTWLSQQVKEDDTVIIYYSGHGAPEEGNTYWVTYEADIDDLYPTALSNDEIYDMLERIQSKRVITFLDSCYSAATVVRKDRTRSTLIKIPWKKFSGTGRVVISASDGTQLSLELDAYQHGVFTYYLLEGLKGNADTNRDGVVEVDEIWDYVKDQVTDTARKYGNPQSPVFQGIITAGIPLTINTAVLKQKKLTELFHQGLISPEHFNRAYSILNSGEPNPLLDGFLAGKIEPRVFSEAFSLGTIFPEPQVVPLTPKQSPSRGFLNLGWLKKTKSLMVFLMPFSLALSFNILLVVLASHYSDRHERMLEQFRSASSRFGIEWVYKAGEILQRSREVTKLLLSFRFFIECAMLSFFVFIPTLNALFSDYDIIDFTISDKSEFWQILGALMVFLVSFSLAGLFCKLLSSFVRNIHVSIILSYIVSLVSLVLIISALNALFSDHDIIDLIISIFTG